MILSKMTEATMLYSATMKAMSELQDTEVTNDEIKEFVGVHGDSISMLIQLVYTAAICNPKVDRNRAKIEMRTTLLEAFESAVEHVDVQYNKLNSQ